MNTKNEMTTQGQSGESVQLPDVPASKNDLFKIFSRADVQAEMGTVARGYLSGKYLASVLFQSVSKNPDLVNCSVKSLMNSIKTLAAMQCEPDGVNGYLVPFRKYDHGQLVEVICTPIPSARGLMRMARLNGLVGIQIGVVREGDEFEWRLIDGKFHLSHVEAGWETNRRVIGVYCSWFDNAGELHGCRMSFNEIEAIRKRSKTYDARKDISKGPWATDWEQMALKTVIKRASKQWDLPLEIGIALKDADESEFGESLEKRSSRVVNSAPINPFSDVPTPEALPSSTQDTGEEPLPNSPADLGFTPMAADPDMEACDREYWGNDGLPGLDLLPAEKMPNNREDY